MANLSQTNVFSRGRKFDRLKAISARRRIFLKPEHARFGQVIVLIARGHYSGVVKRRWKLVDSENSISQRMKKMIPERSESTANGTSKS